MKISFFKSASLDFLCSSTLPKEDRATKLDETRACPHGGRRAQMLDPVQKLARSMFHPIKYVCIGAGSPLIRYFETVHMM